MIDPAALVAGISSGARGQVARLRVALPRVHDSLSRGDGRRPDPPEITDICVIWLGAHEGRSAYLNYVVPGLLLVIVASAIQGTSIMVAMDMTSGIIDRFRTMAIDRASVLTGHVLGSLTQVLAGMAISMGVAFGLGFHADAEPVHWLAAIGILVLFAFALIWLAVALGLAVKSVETASNTPMILILLPFLSSCFVPTATMPPGLRQFAEYQPFTPVTQTVRGLLTGAPIGDHLVAAIGWSTGIAVAAYFWAMSLYNRRRAAEPQ
jgi:ABC-2 type transport system permease protein